MAILRYPTPAYLPKTYRWPKSNFDVHSLVSVTRPLSDALGLIAVLKRNNEVNVTTVPHTTYDIEDIHASYSSALNPLTFNGEPETLSYRDGAFDFNVSISTYLGIASDAGENTTIVFVFGGWTTK